MKEYICIDIGGTAIKYGIINEKAEIISCECTATDASKGGKHILQKVKGIVNNIILEKSISGICISTAGMVDVEEGQIFYSGPSIPEYKGTNFKAELEKDFGIPCEVENDVNCAGLAEYISGAAKGAKNALILTVGTGIGGCAVIDGKVFHGFSNSACEIGYMHIGNSSFQSLGAASVLTKKVAANKKDDEKNWNGIRIFDEAKKGDPICCQAIDEMVEVLGIGIANICYVLNPDKVILGGGIMAQEDFLKEKIRNSIDRNLLPPLAERLELCFAAHRNNAGMLGAFYHFIQMQEKRSQEA